MAAWLGDSQTLVVLTVPNQVALLAWADVIPDCPHVLVREPDIGDEATALAIGPCPFNVHFAHLPLAGRVPAMT